jgi:hypothetical protein
MAERKIPPTNGLEMFVNQNDAITMIQNDPINQDDALIVIQLRDVETVRQWLAELYLEAIEGE